MAMAVAIAIAIAIAVLIVIAARRLGLVGVAAEDRVGVAAMAEDGSRLESAWGARVRADGVALGRGGR